MLLFATQGCSSTGKVVEKPGKTNIVQDQGGPIQKAAGTIKDNTKKINESADVITSKATDIGERHPDAKTTEDTTEIKVQAEKIKQLTAQVEKLSAELLESGKAVSKMQADILKREEEWNKKFAEAQAKYDAGVKAVEKAKDEIITQQKDKIAKLEGVNAEKLNAMLAIAAFLGLLALAAGAALAYIFPQKKLGIGLMIAGPIASIGSIAMIKQSGPIGIIGAVLMASIAVGVVVIIAIRETKKKNQLIETKDKVIETKDKVIETKDRAIDETVRTTAITRDALKQTNPDAEAAIFGNPTSRASAGQVDVIQSESTIDEVRASLERQGLKRFS